MRYFFLIFSFLFLTSCNSEKKHQKPNWLLGKWIRSSNDENKATYEFWNDDFTGIGFTLKEKDTTFVEQMSIFKNKEDLYLQVTGIDQKPTFFKFIKQSENTFTVENNNNQFPKKIKYSFEKDTLKAVISNEEFSVDFKFVKLK